MKWEWFLKIRFEISFNSEVSFSYLNQLNSLTHDKVQSCPLSFSMSSWKLTRMGGFVGFLFVCFLCIIILVLPFRSILSLRLPFLHGNMFPKLTLCGCCQSAPPICASLVSHHCFTSLKRENHITSLAHTKYTNRKCISFWFWYQVFSQFTPTYYSPTHNIRQELKFLPTFFPEFSSRALWQLIL